jgi:hypothetical protein
VLSAVSKSQDIEFEDEVAVRPEPANVVELPDDPVNCAHENVDAIWFYLLKVFSVATQYCITFRAKIKAPILLGA